MKKAICILILLTVLMSFSSCSEYRIEGLENFSSYDSTVETSKYLFPCDDFIDKFEYINGNYYYDYWYYVTYCREKSFAYFEYTPEIYQEVFTFTMDNMIFLENNKYEFNNYTFIQQDASVYYGEKNTPEFPYWFWMMFYSEERNIIGFLGYCYAPTQQKIRADEDFEGFIRYEFPDYDWDT